ncbi:methylglyoxal synthase [Kiloniella sp. b19]|uniref:methylglyoxal synthase n=1 Tax=Kiloniella sp. GXU_MW_B19 TaxID=3141326 RepID=UPI0031DD114E
MTGKDDKPFTMAVVAHDRMKPVLRAWMERHQAVLTDAQIYATGTTARVLQEALPGITIEGLKSGPLGGDQQVGAMIAGYDVDALVFFQDPMTPQPHDVDVKALIRLAVLYDVPLACNEASASLMIKSPLLENYREMRSKRHRETQFEDYRHREL